MPPSFRVQEYGLNFSSTCGYILSRETVPALQERLMAVFGGLSGIRDAGLLDSALARP
jgi:hypothetical protein